MAPALSEHAASQRHAASPRLADPPEHAAPGQHAAPRRVAALVGALGIVLAACTSGPTAVETLTGARVDPATLPASLPLIRSGDHLLVDVSFGEAAASVPLIVDTGAPLTLSDELAEAHGRASGGRIRTVSIDGVVTESDVVSVPRLDLGDAVYADAGAVKGFVEAGNPLACVSPHGLVGATLMDGAVWQFDYPAATLTIAPDLTGVDDVSGAFRIPFEAASDASPTPVIALGVGDGELPFIVDTGSDGWLLLHPADLEAIGVEVADDVPSRTTRASSAAGSQLAEVSFAAIDVTLGDVRLDDAPVALLDSLEGGRGVIGNGFLSRFVLTIDWTERALYLDPVGLDAILVDIVRRATAPPPRREGC